MVSTVYVGLAVYTLVKESRNTGSDFGGNLSMLEVPLGGIQACW